MKASARPARQAQHETDTNELARIAPDLIPGKGGMHMLQLLAQLQAGSVDLLCRAGSMTDVQSGPTMHQRTASVASITEGDTVIFDVNGEKQAFVTVKKTG